MHYHRDTSELTLIVEKFPVHGILVIVKHFFFRSDHRIECIILIEWDIIDTQWVWKWIISRIFYEACEIRIASLEELECLFLRDGLYGRSWEILTKLIDKELRIEIFESISTLEIDREGDMVIHSFDKSLWRKENKKENIHEKNQKRDHENRRDRKKWVSDDIAESVEKDAHEVGVSS